MSKLLVLSFVAPFTALLAAAACSIPSSTATIGIVAPSESMTEWYPVAGFLEHRCGTLECHGSLQRNWISYGCEGLRADPLAVTGCVGKGAATTSTEYDDTFRSLVALEPVVMSEVVLSGGQNPDLLTFVRKMRGEENHKGGALVVAGDPQDVCVTSWLAGNTDTNACATALSNYQ